ncbi:peptidylprolyl isomerase [Catenibacterium sp. AM22-15]|uniref:peptidylprolyl isomerase n=1 Tax=Catenibacterium mitsuokai TaxID=100886 RepID=UPI000E3F0885|nr:peptidylprolyl isomerase [Catenibacterium sp. AM22-6LB]RGF09644.1 peptidylprolyl isomerase [Catenibacterium sp. AM22-15]
MKKLIRIILALAIGSTLIGCSSKSGGTIDLTSNIKVSIKGFNGKGEVYIDNNTKYDKTNSDIRDFVADIEYTLENVTNGALSNGDEITIKAKYSKSKAKDLGLTIKNPTKKVKVSGLKDLLTGYYDCEIKVKNYGSIKLKLDANIAPITVSNFVGLANDGFYNGLTFHRIIKGFMIQGGDPNGDGTGGSKQTIKGEFSANGVDNPLKHTRGVISMARSQSYDSASSQFFIMHEDTSSLDGQYAAFGCAYSGMDIVDKICDDVKTEDSNGTVSKKNQPVIESITCTKIQ